MGRVAWPQLLMGGRLFEKMLVEKGVGLGRVLSENPENVQKMTNILGILGLATSFCMFYIPRM